LSHVRSEKIKEAVRYGEAFKLRLVEDGANGTYKSLDEAKRRNGIRGVSTLSAWIKQYGRAEYTAQKGKGGNYERLSYSAFATRFRSVSKHISPILPYSGSLWL
jgi:transposase-like protein